MSFQERRREFIRREIAQGALQLFAEKGFDAVTVGEIVAHLDISPRTFFRYFPSKQDVLFADHEQRFAHFREALDARPAREPVLESLRVALMAVAEIYDREEGEVLATKMRVIRESPSLLARSLQLESAWDAVVADMVAQRTRLDRRRDLRPQVVGTVWPAALRIAIVAWLEEDGRRPLSTILAGLLDILGEGFTPVLAQPRRSAAGR